MVEFPSLHHAKVAVEALTRQGFVNWDIFEDTITGEFAVDFSGWA